MSEGETKKLVLHDESRDGRGWIPDWLFHGNGEALAWCLDSMARGVSFTAFAAFLSVALLMLGKQAAGCETSPPPGETDLPECDKVIYGMRPSSMLTSYSAFVGFFSAFLLPLAGAIIDYTIHRRFVGRMMCFLMCALMFVQIFISEKTWFYVCLIQIAVSLFGWGLNMVSYAYLPELTLSKDRLNSYTQIFSVATGISMVVFLLAVLGISYAAGRMNDNIFPAQLSQALSFVLTSIMLFISWGILFQDRPSFHELPEGGSLWTAGFIQLAKTSVLIHRNYPSLKWFLISCAFTDSALHSFGSITITYCFDKIGFTTREGGLLFLSMMMGFIPGGPIGGWFVSLFNPIVSNMLGTIVAMLSTTFAALFVVHPGQQTLAYIGAGMWGIGLGWKWTIDRLLISLVMPHGQDAEIMGFFLFVGQSLTWLPPLIYTIMNEKGFDPRIGLFSLNIYCTIGLISLCLMGDFRTAVEAVGKTYLLDQSSTTTSDQLEASQDYNNSRTSELNGNSQLHQNNEQDKCDKTENLGNTNSVAITQQTKFSNFSKRTANDANYNSIA